MHHFYSALYRLIPPSSVFFRLLPPSSAFFRGGGWERFLRLLAVDPLVEVGRACGGKGIEQTGGLGFGDDEVAMSLADEILGDSVVEEREERVVEAFDIEQAVRLLVEAELGPGEDFGKFLERAETAGKGDEGIGKVGHEGLAFVHGGDDAEVFEALMGDFLRDERFGDDADDFAAGSERGIGDGAHQADATAAEDEADVALGEERAEIAGGPGISGPGAAVGAAINAEAFNSHGDRWSGSSFIEKIMGTARNLGHAHPHPALSPGERVNRPLTSVNFMYWFQSSAMVSTEQSVSLIGRFIGVFLHEQKSPGIHAGAVKEEEDDGDNPLHDAARGQVNLDGGADEADEGNDLKGVFANRADRRRIFRFELAVANQGEAKVDSPERGDQAEGNGQVKRPPVRHEENKRDNQDKDEVRKATTSDPKEDLVFLRGDVVAVDGEGDEEQSGEVGGDAGDGGEERLPLNQKVMEDFHRAVSEIFRRNTCAKGLFPAHPGKWAKASAKNKEEIES
jgi:hypothetical protein